MRQIIYYYRGQIEVQTRKGYEWRDGYSANTATGGMLYPWEPKYLCRQDAKAQGGRAVFVESLA